MKITKSVNVVVEGKTKSPKEVLIKEAKALDIETDGLTVAQLKEAIEAKK